MESGARSEVPLGNAHEVSSPIFTIDQELCGRYGVLNPAKLPKGDALSKVVTDLMSCFDRKEIVATLLRGRGELGPRMIGYSIPENGSDGVATTNWTAIVLELPRVRDEIIARVKRPDKLGEAQKAELGGLSEQVEFSAPAVTPLETSQSDSKMPKMKHGKSIPCAPPLPSG